MLPYYFRMQFCGAFLKNITTLLTPISNEFWLTILMTLLGATTSLCMQFNFLLWKITIPGNSEAATIINHQINQKPHHSDAWSS